MSAPSVPSDEFARTAPEALSALFETLVAVTVPPVRFVAFWAATLLPFTYLPLLATGTATDNPVGFAAMVVVNAVAFVVGHSYKRTA